MDQSWHWRTSPLSFFSVLPLTVQYSIEPDSVMWMARALEKKITAIVLGPCDVIVVAFCTALVRQSTRGKLRRVIQSNRRPALSNAR